MCTGHDLVAGVACARLTYAENRVFWAGTACPRRCAYSLTAWPLAPIGRGWVCVWRGAGSRGGGGGAGWYILRGEGETSTYTVCPQDCQEWYTSPTFITGQSRQGQPPLECSISSHELPMAFRNGVASADVSRRRGRRLQGCPPLECSVRSDELPVSMRMRMCVVM